jgi:hypothetical protein
MAQKRLLLGALYLDGASLRAMEAKALASAD